MKKLIATVAVLACAASVVSAQTVTSQNIVGYNKDVSAIGFHISGMQFDNAVANTPTTVYGDSLPLNSKIYTWNGSGYVIATYGQSFVPFVGLVTKWNSEPVLGNGEGYWVESTGAAESVLSGEVPLDAAITNSVAAGFSMLSYPYPVDRVITELGFTPVLGDKIYAWNGTGYTIVTYGQSFVPFVGLVTKWNNETLPISVGEGFWYETATPQTWIATKPFSE